MNSIWRLFIPGKHKPSPRIRPSYVRIEASTVCQLDCPLCPTAKGDVGRLIGQGFLKFSHFKKFIDKNPSIRGIELSNWGELFLNNELLDIIRYAHQKNVQLTAYNGANLNTVSPKILEALVKYKFHSITCSIDGTTQETYQI